MEVPSFQVSLRLVCCCGLQSDLSTTAEAYLKREEWLEQSIRKAVYRFFLCRHTSTNSASTTGGTGPQTGHERYDPTLKQHFLAANRTQIDILRIFSYAKVAEGPTAAEFRLLAHGGSLASSGASESAGGDDATLARTGGARFLEARAWIAPLQQPPEPAAS